MSQKKEKLYENIELYRRLNKLIIKRRSRRENETAAATDNNQEMNNQEIVDNYKSELTINYELERTNESGMFDELKAKLNAFRRRIVSSSAFKALIDQLKSVAKHPAVHGVVCVVDRDVLVPFRVMWLLFIVISWSMSFFVISNLVLAYNQYPVKSTFRIAHEPKRLFPAVSICNLCPYDGAYSYEDIQNIIKENNVSAPSSDNLFSYVKLMDALIKTRFELNKLTMSTTFDIYRQSFYLSQMLISCEFDGLKCSASDFYWFHDYNFGNCYRFNGRDGEQTLSDGSEYTVSSSLRSQVKPGWESGLRLELYSGTQPTTQQYLYKVGFRVIIHNQSVRPFPDEDGIDVPVGKETNIGIARSFVYRLPRPYSNCITELDENEAKRSDMLRIVREKIKGKQIYKYQQNYCLKVCTSLYYTRKCNCTSFSLAFLELNNSSAIYYCSSLRGVECLEQAEVEFLNSADIEQCYAQCPVECTKVTYELEKSWSSYPSDWYAKGVRANAAIYGYDNFFYDQTYEYDGPTYDIIKRSTSVVNIFYKTVRYSVLTETPLMPLQSLISNIGSCLALFAGASLLTSVVLIEIIVSLLIKLKRHLFIRFK